MECCDRAGFLVTRWKQEFRAVVWMEVKNVGSRKGRSGCDRTRLRETERIEIKKWQSFQVMWGMRADRCFSVTLWEDAGEMRFQWAAGGRVWVVILQRLDEWCFPGVQAEKRLWKMMPLIYSHTVTHRKHGGGWTRERTDIQEEGKGKEATGSEKGAMKAALRQEKTAELKSTNPKTNI